MGACDDYTLNVADVVELEGRIADSGTPLSELMRNAGAALADAVVEQAQLGSQVCVLAGSGNNGGDGWVAAELLNARGYRVVLATTRAPEELRAEPAASAAKHALDAAPGLQVLVSSDADALTAELAKADVAVDALLGTGFAGNTLRAPSDSWIDALNTAHNAGLFVIAADVPSGVSAQTGRCARPSVQADLTVTMMVSKPGLAAAANVCGCIRIAHICDLTPHRAFLEEHAINLEKPL